MLSTYDSYRFYAQDLAKSVSRVAAQPAVQRDTAYYQANIGKVKTVDDFLKNPRLYTYALTTYGLEDAIPNRGFIRKVLTSDTTDPKSFVNKLNDTRYRAFAAAFAFTATGKVVTTAVAQDAAQEDETLGLYSRRTLTLGPQPNATAATKAQQDDLDYYKAHIGRVSSLSDLTGDHRLYRIALQAYGLDPATPADTVTHLLESDRYDPKSFVDRSAPSTDAAQSLSATRSTAALYTASVGTGAAAQAAAAVETAYFEREMPEITSVDAFLSDGRLVAYATQAFNLGGSADAIRTYAKAHGVPAGKALTDVQTSDLLRAALTSDLSQAGNVADTVGGGFRTMAAAFGFGPTSLQSPADTDATVARYGQQAGSDDASRAAAAAETAYYRATVPKLKTPDQFVADPRLMDYATKAYGLTFKANATPDVKRAAVAAALAGDPTAAGGAAATLGSAFVDLASAFNSAKPAYAQSAASAESTIDLYGQAAAGDADAAAETQHYMDAMPGVKSVDDLLADDRLTAYVVKAYGITVPADASAEATRARLRAVLTSDPTDPAGAAAQGGTATRRLASAFRFDAKGAASASPRPAVASGTGLQTASARLATADLYAERLGPDFYKQLKGQIEAEYSQSVLAGAASLDDVVGDPRVVNYLATAYGIGFADKATDADKAGVIRTILSSDPDDPKSVASHTGNDARALASAFAFSHVYDGDAAVTRNGRPDLVAFASAFNFDAAGHVAPPRLAQAVRDTNATLSLYNKVATAAGAEATAIKADVTYYQHSIGAVRTLGGFLSDPSLVGVATAAYGVSRPAGLSDAAWTDRLKSVLTSDLADPKSAANRLGGAYPRLAAAFDFAKDGTVGQVQAQRVQSGKAADLMAAPHATLVMEDQAGDASPGVKLALYYKRLAPGITSMYQILADKSLLSVVTTTLGLPSNFSKIDIDAQARIIGNKLKKTDLTDPKKLDAFIKRFTVLYDADKLTDTPPRTPLDAAAGGTEVTSNTLLATLNAGRSTAKLAPILQIFNPT